MIKTCGGFGKLVVAAFTGSTAMSVVTRLVHDYGSLEGSQVYEYLLLLWYCVASMVRTTRNRMDDVNEMREGCRSVGKRSKSAMHASPPNRR
jgi:hypothetical protein